MQRHLGPSVLLAILLSAGVACAQTTPVLQTNQSLVERLARANDVDVKDPLAVFGFVLGSLPERVKVYPTENYFYFTFISNAVEFAGNIRLDASDRDQGKVQFGYYEQTTLWRDETETTFRTLDQKDGVQLEKVERFLYRLKFRDKSVLFELNDLSDVKPPAAVIAPDERYIGPVFDESGIRFFLVYRRGIKNFLYVLDETIPVNESVIPGERNDRLLLGKRTGFVFYCDHRRERKILVGVYEDNARINNYFDGPFDQLPDNFIEGESLRDALLEIDPKLKGQIDRFGGTPDGSVRYMIAPYLLYKQPDQFNSLQRCATRHRAGAENAYYRCFILDNERQDLTSRPPKN